MTTSITATPRGVIVTVHNSTAQNLWTLLKAIDSGCPQHCCWLNLQANIGNLDKLVFLGNSDLDTSTRYGSELQAGVALPVLAFDSNLIDLNSIYVATDGTDVKLNVAYSAR